MCLILRTVGKTLYLCVHHVMEQPQSSNLTTFVKDFNWILLQKLSVVFLKQTKQEMMSNWREQVIIMVLFTTLIRRY